MDAGAEGVLIGNAFCKTQMKEMDRHWPKAVWQELRQSEYMRGVGRGAQACIRKVQGWGVLRDGPMLGYDATILDDDLFFARREGGGMVFVLYGLQQFTKFNALVHSSTDPLLEVVRERESRGRRACADFNARGFPAALDHRWWLLGWGSKP